MKKWLITLMLLIPVVSYAEMRSFTLKVDPPALDTRGNPLDRGTIIGYDYYFTLDKPVTKFEDFPNPPVTKMVVFEPDTGDVIDDATELELVFDLMNEETTHIVYATVVVKGAGGLDSVPYEPILPIEWKVTSTGPARPAAPLNFQTIDDICRTNSWRWVCEMVGL